MSNSTILSIPQNDHQLTTVINSFNAAYDKYFDAGVSKKRSDKLRDCICEGLGFTNGAYQELQAYWAAQFAFDFSNPDNIIALVSERTGGYQSIFSKAIATSIVEYLCTNFPLSNTGELLIESELPDDKLFSDGCVWEDYGWDLLIHDEQHDQIIQKERELGHWLPLYYGQLIIGFAFNKEEADILNAMLKSAAWEKQININGEGSGKRQDLQLSIEWKNYVNQSNVSTELQSGKYVSLRRESMDASVIINFDSVVIEEEQITLHLGGQKQVLAYDDKKDIVTYQGLEFDFISFYTKGDGRLSISQGKFGKGSDWAFSSPIHSGMNAIEWFPKNRIEYVVDDEADSDDLTEITNLENNAFLIK